MTADSPSGGASATGCPVAFSGTIAPTSLSVAYRCGLVLVTVAMIVVPLLYVSFAALVGWLLVWHVTANTWILSGSGLQFRLLGYLTPVVVLAILLFFLVKPLIARRATWDEPLQIGEDQQPVLHALIREICRQVHAPVPARVFVDCQVNASASLRGGVFGVFRRDLDLTIGLPLVAGLSVRQLSGVLAHEFGHFAQRGGMRMTALVRAVNDWLLRAVYERDTWDRTLDAWSRDGDLRVIVPMALARVSVWVSRRVLFVVTLVGHGVSCYMLRQMEYDADSYEIKVAGTDTFERTFTRLRELSAGTQMAHEQLAHLLERRAAPADFPRFIVDSVGWLPDQVRDGVRKISDQPTDTFDTHPSDADRVAAARDVATSGALVGGDAPAASLFRDLDRLAETVTRHHYERGLGITLDAVRLLSPDEARYGAHDYQRTEAAVRDVFASRLSVTRPLRILVDGSAGDAGNIVEDLDRARAAISASSVTEESYRAYEHFVFRHDLAYCAEQLFLAGVETIDAEQFSLAEPTLEGARLIQRWAIEEQDKLRADLDRFDHLVAQRLALGVRLLDHQENAAEAHAAVRALTALADAVPLATEAHRHLMLAALLDQVEDAMGTSHRFGAHAGGLHAHLDQCRTRVLAILEGATVPEGELGDRWRRLLAEAPGLDRGDVMRGAIDLYWACLTRLTRLVTDGEARHAHDATHGGNGPPASGGTADQRQG